jgi:hypothetical protein
MRSQTFARHRFVITAARMWPRMLKDLDRQTRAIASDLLEPKGQVLGTRGIVEVAADADCDEIPEAKPLQLAIKHWARDWHLGAPWVREYAIATVQNWRDDFPRDQWWLPPIRLGVDRAKRLAREELTFKGWHPGGEHWEQWKREFFRQLPAGLEAYHLKQMGRARQVGMVPAQRWLLGHFEWLAWRQIRGHSAQKIADRAGRTRSHVSEVVNELARLIGLTLRHPDVFSERPRQSRRGVGFSGTTKNPASDS